MPIDPSPLVWQDGPAGGTTTSAGNFNRITAEVASEIDERITVRAAVDAALYVPLTDARLTNARTPTAHTQTASTITDFSAAADARIALGGAAPTARFKGSLLSSVAVTGGANIPFTTLDDPASGWNASTKLWVCAVAGTYIAIGSIKMNGTGVGLAINILKNGAVTIASPNLPSAAYSGGTVTGYLRLAIGDTVAMRVNTTYTTQSDTPADNNYLELVQVQF